MPDKYATAANAIPQVSSSPVTVSEAPYQLIMSQVLDRISDHIGSIEVVLERTLDDSPQVEADSVYPTTRYYRTGAYPELVRRMEALETRLSRVANMMELY